MCIFWGVEEKLAIKSYKNLGYLNQFQVKKSKACKNFWKIIQIFLKWHQSIILNDMAKISCEFVFKNID